MKPIWIVDDDQSIRFVLEKALAREDLAVRWVPFDESLAMIGDGRITDAITIIGLQALALERRTATTP